MSDGALDRRNFLKSAVVGGAAAATPAPLPETAKAEQAATASAAEGYAFFNLAEAAFVEALVDHMVPADELSPKATDIGINVYIDRALAGGWGKGERLYAGPMENGDPEPGLSVAAHSGAALPRRH
jgi:gluconate 2-dehydrogenase gamma chain